MIENKIVLKPLSEIIIDQDKRQRGLNQEKVIETAKSIANHSLIHAVILDKETDRLIAGGHRCAAFAWLQAQGVGCEFPSYKNWTVIPVRYAINCTPAEIEAIELEENIKRSDLTWQEEALAFARFHRISKEINSEWTGTDTANALGCSSAFVSKRLQIAAELDAGNPKITACTGISSAINVINRQNERLIAAEVELMSEVTADAEPQTNNSSTESSSEGTNQIAIKKTSTIIPADQTILCTNFIEWVKDYSGKKFNFLHCDFPYGINHQKSEQGNSAIHGAYNDTPDVYWELLKVLTENKDKLLTTSCHIMFWHSGDWEITKKTREFFATYMSDFHVQSFEMIWHKTDNKGLLPDPNRYGRRTYETAFCLSRGDRKIVTPVSLSYGAPTGPKEHLSVKPEPMLRHFFRMFVDEFTIMLDPTCGSGSAVRAAESLNARHIIGLELDPENHANACTGLTQMRNLKAMETE